MNKEGLMLYPGGRLLRTKWHYDDALSSGAYIEEDVTEFAHTYLFEPTELHSGVTLQDLFTLLDKNPIIQAMQHRNFIGSLMSEYQKVASVPNKPAYSVTGIEYLEIYHVWQKNSVTNELVLSYRPNFHGVGFELKEDFTDGLLSHAKGERIKWGISFAPLATLLPLPLRQNNSVSIFESDLTSPLRGRVIEKLQLESSTLGALIEGVLWELSFHGSDEDKEETIAVIQKDIKTLVDAGTISAGVTVTTT